MPEIKECPFCKSDRIELCSKFYFRCLNCEAEGPLGDTEEAALNGWNAAPRPPQVKKLRELLEEARIVVIGNAQALEETNGKDFFAVKNLYDLSDHIQAALDETEAALIGDKQ